MGVLTLHVYTGGASLTRSDFTRLHLLHLYTLEQVESALGREHV
jgi:hypothetical protein